MFWVWLHKKLSDQWGASLPYMGTKVVLSKSCHNANTPAYSSISLSQIPSKTLQYLNITVENFLELAVGRWKLNKGSVRWALKRNKSEPCGWKDSFSRLIPHKEIVRVSIEVLVRTEFPWGYVGVYFLLAIVCEWLKSVAGRSWASFCSCVWGSNISWGLDFFQI